MFGPWFLLTLAASLGSLVILMILRRINRSPNALPTLPDLRQFRGICQKCDRDAKCSSTWSPRDLTHTPATDKLADS
jgi:hypothetical protein